MRRNSYISQLPAKILTTPLDSATLISYKTVIFRQSEYIFYAFLDFLSRNPPYFYFRSAWPNFLKSGTHVTLANWIPYTKFEADPTIRYRYMTPYLQNVSLHCESDDWPFDLEWFSGIFITRSNPAPNLSVLRRSVLELRRSHSDCY